jgi:hypothetical protein
LCKYSQHDLSASIVGWVLIVRDGCHLAVGVLVVVGGFAGFEVVFSVVGSAIVAT